jgi:hypothetical protein
MTQKVSHEFKKAWAKSATAVEVAKKAENQLSNCPLPLGFEGRAVVSGMVMDSKNDSSYVRMEYTVVDDKEYKGKKCSRLWSLKASEKRTMEAAIGSFLDDMENQGLPRDVRENMSGPEDISNWFLSENRYVRLAVKEDTWSGSRDGKRVTTYRENEPVGTDSSMSPTTSSVPFEIPSPEHSDTVMFLGKQHTVIARDGDMLQIKSPEGKIKNVTKEQLDN